MRHRASRHLQGDWKVLRAGYGCDLRRHAGAARTKAHHALTMWRFPDQRLAAPSC